MARSPAKAPKRKRTAAEAVAPAPAGVSAFVAAAMAPAVDVAGDVPVSTAVPAVALAANCSIKDVAALRQRLCAMVDTPAAIAIDASAVERIDTASLQLLYAFVRDRVAADREVVWQGVSAALADAARLLGMQDLLCLSATSAVAA